MAFHSSIVLGSQPRVALAMILTIMSKDEVNIKIRRSLCIKVSVLLVT